MTGSRVFLLSMFLVLAIDSLCGQTPPVFSPAPGVVTCPVVVTITEATPGTVLLLTNDGSQPSTSATQMANPNQFYGPFGPFPVSTSTTFKAIALLPAGSNQPSSDSSSGVSEATYTCNVFVLTEHNDNARTGANLSEVALNTSNVNTHTFGKLFERAVVGAIYGQPLIVSGIKVQGRVRNVVYVATMHNSVFAFDADDPAAVEPLWVRQLDIPVPLPQPGAVPFGSGYSNIATEIGITSTPVISLIHNAIYVVTFGTDVSTEPCNPIFCIALPTTTTYHHELHALDLRTGQPLFGSPRTIDATAPGLGDTSRNGQISLIHSLQNQRAALLLANDNIYIAFASFGDQGPYHGWVLAFNAGTLAPLPNVFIATPNGSQAGIWQGGQGPAADSEGNIYFITGNGTFAENNIVAKVVLPETAVGAPALADFNDSQLVVGWTGTNWNHNLNVLASPDGATFDDSAKVTLEETSIDGPALAVGNGQLIIAWTGTDSAHSINIESSTDLRNFGNKTTLRETSPYGPALAFGNAQVFLAWTGTDLNHSLNVMSSTDGRTFGNQVILPESSNSAPHLAFVNGTLFLLWQGLDTNLNILQSTDGKTFTNKVTLNESSNYAPSLSRAAGFRQRTGFWLVWTGRNLGGNSLNLDSGAQTNEFGGKVTYSDSSVAAPALGQFKGLAFIGWAGTTLFSPTINVAQLGGQPSLGDSFVKLDSDLSLLDWFSPFDTDYLSNGDEDLGSGGLMLLPGTQLLVGGGKQGKLYLINSNNLGRNCGTCTASTGDTQIVESFQATGTGPSNLRTAPMAKGRHHIHGAPVFWASSKHGALIYLGGEDDNIRAFHFNGTGLDKPGASTNIISNSTTPEASMPGAMLSISANGSTARTGILWVTHPRNDNEDANQGVVAGILRAFDADSLQLLWDSASNPNKQDEVGNCSKFSPPTVANGKVYVATFSNRLVVYGLK